MNSESTVAACGAIKYKLISGTLNSDNSSWTGDGGYHLYYYSTTRKLIFYARSTVHFTAKTYTIQAYSEKFPLNYID
jgi:hypothetical protein